LQCGDRDIAGYGSVMLPVGDAFLTIAIHNGGTWMAHALTFWKRIWRIILRAFLSVGNGLPMCLSVSEVCGMKKAFHLFAASERLLFCRRRCCPSLTVSQ